ncbi:S8 family serine peptidase [Fodinicola acaciae]|uniref:S8 family serine peptidase n=1 Tax=Fodinicola acaciae TaxID=2681555 RepID=UPI0013D2B62F|nr:S8 family serine peptidase [Fodinicola acaciae]
MRHRLRNRALVATTAVLALAATASTGPASAAPARQSTGKTTITLVTGDTVTLLAGGRVSVRPGKGREKMPFTVRSGHDRTGDHQYVIPADALRMVSAGTLDLRLFDLQTLRSYGYDDAHRPDIPLILQNTTGAQPKVAGATVKQDRSTAGFTTVRADKKAGFWSSATTSGRTAAGIQRIWLDGKRKVTLDQSVPQIGGPVAWAAGFTGKGTTTAILDTGIDATHPDFAGKISETKDFTDTTLDDKVGHGTHVASIITGSGAASNGKYKGVAPDTKLAIGKVCGDQYCEDSAILAGMTWAAKTVHAKVVNISIGGGDTPGLDPLETAVEDLSAATGTLFVIAAGNDGCDGCVNSPGSADSALTVAAVDKKDKLANFSSRGPRIGDSAIKPDIAAPGVNIVAAKAKNGVIGVPSDNPKYVSLDGTSMATPHVAGSAAIIAGEHPDWTGQRIKAALMASAKQLDGIGVFSQGAGRVDVGKAVGQQLTANPPSVSVPKQYWPHNDDKPVAKEVSYHNGGKSAVSLTLSATVTGPGGKPAPAGMFALSAKTIDVPAGGDASVTVTTDTRVAGPDGRYTGQIVATGGNQAVRTPIAVEKEVESYNLTIVGVDRTGAPAGIVSTMLVDYAAVGGPQFGGDADGDGTFTIRQPKGTYGLSVYLAPADRSTGTDIDTPVINLTRDTVLTIDARKAKPVDITVDRPDASASGVDISGKFYYAGGYFSSGILSFGDGAGLFTGSNGRGGKQYYASVSAGYAKRDADGGISNTPYAYHLGRAQAGAMFDGVTIHAKTSELAHVKNRELNPGGAAVIDRFVWLSTPDGLPAGSSTVYGGPATIDQYLSPGAPWSLVNTVGASHLSSDIMQASQARTYPRGEHTVDFDRGVFGPGFRFVTHTVDARTVQYPNGIFAAPQLLSDGDLTHSGVARTFDSNTATLYRDGTKVAHSDDGTLLTYEAPATDATYKLEAHQVQHFMPVSTTVDASWTFASRKTTNHQGDVLPLFALRFTPKLSDSNKAPAGAFTIPVTVDRQDGAAKATVSNPTIEYSTDDGRTWQKTAAAPAGNGRWTVKVTNPASGFVSLRTNATDSAANTSAATIIRAYAIG